MSLHALAGHMAAKGRGSDSMLVHMTPEEVQSLQVLALRAGGTLTINPDTGLPEANFLKKMLPMIAGFALGPAGFGLMSAGMAGVTVGGITALSTGSLSRGLMAGLGAYGGASLGAGLASAGEGAIAAGNLAGTLPAAPELAGLSAEAAAAATSKYAGQVNALRDAALSKAGEAGLGAKMTAGLGQMASNPGMYAKDVLKSAYAAATPMMAADMVQTTTPRTETTPSYIRAFDVDPYTQRMQALKPIDASTIRLPRQNFAGGGIVALAAGGASSVEQLYRDIAGRGSDPEGLKYWTQQFGDTIDPNEINIFKTAVAEARAQGTEPADVTQAQANEMVQNMYRNVLNRDVEQSGLNYWSDMIQQSNDPARIYQDFLTAAKANTELGKFDTSFGQAITPFQGYRSADTGSNADEWVRNVLKREVTDADRNQKWYKDMAGVTTAAEAQQAYNDFLKSTGAKTNLDWMAASQLAPLRTTPKTSAPAGTTNPYGNATNPGDLTFNPDGSTTVQPNIPGRPYGGFAGMQQVKDAYTAGGGSLGYVPYAPATLQEFQNRFTNTGGSKQAYDYLMNKGAADIRRPITKTGELMLPYADIMGLRRPGPPVMRRAPVIVDKYGVVQTVYGGDGGDGGDSGASGSAGASGSGDAAGDAAAAAADSAAAAAGDGAGPGTGAGWAYGGEIRRMALGGLGALAGGGSTSQYNLGSYSDGGRLLRGPGDGVSDSIPATIGDKQPARLADGEFVVPARIVSELGNGSTEAGARKLYAMMDRVQKARGKTTGKNRVAANTRADKYLPA